VTLGLRMLRAGLASALHQQACAAGGDDLSGTWVLETIGAQTVTAPTYSNPFHLKSIGVILVQVAQTGSDVTLPATTATESRTTTPPTRPGGRSRGLGHTAFPIQRSGTFADNGSGQWELTLPTAIEVAGANLADRPTTPCLRCQRSARVDTDNDGFPGSPST